MTPRASHALRPARRLLLARRLATVRCAFGCMHLVPLHTYHRPRASPPPGESLKPASAPLASLHKVADVHSLHASLRPHHVRLDRAAAGREGAVFAHASVGSASVVRPAAQDVRATLAAVCSSLQDALAQAHLLQLRYSSVTAPL